MQVSIILPTLNERDSLPILLDELQDALHTLDYTIEVIVVDDGSTDGTRTYVKQLSNNQCSFPVRLIERNERGLATAVIRGFSESKGDLCIVMDADLSHPPALLPSMIKALANGVDIVLPSRYMPGGGSEDWTRPRKFISRIATSMARLVEIKASDPMSGFFGLHRRVIEGASLSPIGYKILLEILVKGTYQHTLEIAYTFRNRSQGKSKMTKKVVMQYITHLFRLRRWKKSTQG